MLYTTRFLFLITRQAPRDEICKWYGLHRWRHWKNYSPKPQSPPHSHRNTERRRVAPTCEHSQKFYTTLTVELQGVELCVSSDTLILWSPFPQGFNCLQDLPDNIGPMLTWPLPGHLAFVQGGYQWQPKIHVFWSRESFIHWSRESFTGHGFTLHLVNQWRAMSHLNLAFGPGESMTRSEQAETRAWPPPSLIPTLKKTSSQILPNGRYR